MSSSGDPVTFDTNQVEEGTAVTHSASSGDFQITENGIYRVTYSVVATNTTSSGTVGVQLENGGTPIPGSAKSASIANTSDTATLAASVLVNVTGGNATITLDTTEANVTITNAGLIIQKLD